ncbi:MAG: GNAT family N-acetyltransferase [Clostridia bacterium]|nr:GNAT family N-acetyltransferase [Clostridia bacterium]
MDIIFVDDIELMNKVENLAKENNDFPFNSIDCKTWALVENNNLFGYLIIQHKYKDTYKIEHFFIINKVRRYGYGEKLLFVLFRNALTNGIVRINVEFDKSLNRFERLLKKMGFKNQMKDTPKSNVSMCYYVNEKNLYNSLLNVYIKNIKNSLLLNPTENFPFYDNFDTSMFEGLYVSENKRGINDKIIFGGRNDIVDLYDFVKETWCKRLNCAAVDLKTFSGLNAHLLFFLCAAKPGDTVVLLPEEAGGHYATKNILTKIGLNVIPLIIDKGNHCVDIEKSKIIIYKNNPQFILIDRSEGLKYEDFTWLSEFKCTKVFDASQYITQILTKHYPDPLKTFDVLISTLHKNYPGPQKCLICTKSMNDTWNEYEFNSKTFISNNHPSEFISSIIPLLDIEKLKKYSIECIQCVNRLYDELLKNGLPVVERGKSDFYTLHIWLKPETRDKSYQLYLKLEQLKILTNYRLLPYDIGYGIRIGINGAVRQGLRGKHIAQLAGIIKEAYFQQSLSKKLINQSRKFIKKITAK